ncbi:MAG: hypothetical protein A2X91_09880 [Deltaproteobacteria bacterium GWB2_65_81]|nr:MAG: hypothetical protein A2X90_03995 [Deltaproteobacteria bacterium GWA2_65_63]OGP28135.1 MAG: hypothetical protein A2X91_09880 [Deltaproteobacteria bacterium GWB2_65_81]
MRHSSPFLSVRTEGALFPADILAQIASKTFGGVTPEAYHLDGENLNEAISRSWNRLLGVWKSFQTARAALPPGDFGTTLTREKWLYKLFQELGYGRLQSTRPFEIDGKSYPVSHLWRNVPIHLVGCGVDIDKTHVSPGIIRHQPHGMVQEFLNRSDDHLFALLSNGLLLRLLRDNASLVRRAFVEFDLESMMDGESFPDFSLLWLLCHQSRVEADRPEESPLERWVQGARKEGVQALDRLREGVEGAIVALGVGFLEHRANDDLRDALRAGRLDRQDYYRSVLRLVYRLVFLFVAEERDLLCPVERGGEGAARRRQYLTRYLPHYSLTRIRGLAERHPGSRHDDLYRMTSFILGRLGNAGSDDLGLSPLGSGLFDPEISDPLPNSRLSNHAFLDAIRALTILSDEGHGRRPISYRNLGSEELGSVYEFLLELHPDLNLEAMTFALKLAAGNERKTTGSYYTPTSLIESLLKTALDPKLDEAARHADPEKAILGLNLCDPACGSGHFLVAAAHRMAGRLGQIRCGGEPSELVFRQALRDVIGHCLYGVDINPMSVELCKVSLWMESMEPGKPLSFLDHRIVCGNSLLGTTPALMAQGVPDEAFQPLEGDERARVNSMRRQNRAERAGQGTLQFGGAVSATTYRLGEAIRELDKIDDTGINGIREKEEKHHALLESEDLTRARESAGAWSAVFVAPRTAEAPQWTHDTFRRVSEGGLSALPSAYRESFRRLSEEYRFFYWHVAFPDVFSIPETGIVGVGPHGWTGGFDVVLGNPPWERLKLQEQEYFAERRPDIANAPNAAARRRMIRDLDMEDPVLFHEYKDALRKAEGESHIARNAGIFPLCGRGDVNTYALFAEQFLNLMSPDGRAGIIVPTGIATDDGTKGYIDEVVTSHRLASFYSFENEEFIFRDVHHSYRFCLMTLLGTATRQEAVDFLFFARKVENLEDERRHFTLSPAEVAALNPNTKTCPIFRSKMDAELARKIYARVPVLFDEARGADGNPWGINFQRMFDMANDSGLFRTHAQMAADGATLDGTTFCLPDGKLFLPLYEAKMVHQFDHRWATYEQNGEDSRDATDAEKANPAYSVLPRYWVPKEEVDKRLADKGWTYGWLMGWRDVTSAHVLRTMIATVVPRCGVGHKMPLFMLNKNIESKCKAAHLANLNSLVLDFLARQKVGGTSLTYFYLKQFPVLPPSDYDEATLAFITSRILELVYTAEDLRPFAVDLGYTGNPFPWDPSRRAVLRAELDAYYAKLYGLTRDELRYILDPTDVYGEDYPSETFRVLKNNEMREFGEYRTRRLVLEAWDRVSQEEKTDR